MPACCDEPRRRYGGTTGYVVSSIEQHGFIAGLVRSAFVPGLMPGTGGMAYQLLRMDPACRLPSVLLIGHRSALPAAR